MKLFWTVVQANGGKNLSQSNHSENKKGKDIFIKGVTRLGNPLEVQRLSEKFLEKRI